MSCSCNNNPPPAVVAGLPKALVIGGSRFIGLPLVKLLLGGQYDVTVLNRGTRNDKLPATVKTIACDRTDHPALGAALAGKRFNVVFDCVSYRPEDTQALLHALDRTELQHFVHISTGSVYLPTEVFPIKEHFARGLQGPGHEYGDRKYLIEEILFKAARDEGFPATMIRPGVIFGPGNYVYREAFFFDRLLAGRPLVVPGDGSLIMQYGYVDDLAAMMVSVIGNERAIGEAYNHQGEYCVTTDYYMRTLVEVVGERFGSERPQGAVTGTPEVVYYDPRSLGMGPEEVRKVYPFRWREHVIRDTSKAQMQLGWRETVGLREGLRRSLEWYLAGGRAECGFRPEFALEDAILARLGR